MFCLVSSFVFMGFVRKSMKRSQTDFSWQEGWCEEVTLDLWQFCRSVHCDSSGGKSGQINWINIELHLLRSRLWVLVFIHITVWLCQIVNSFFQEQNQRFGAKWYWESECINAKCSKSWVTVSTRPKQQLVSLKLRTNGNQLLWLFVFVDAWFLIYDLLKKEPTALADLWFIVIFGLVFIPYHVLSFCVTSLKI